PVSRVTMSLHDALPICNLGSAAESAVPKLVRRLDDPEPPIRSGAAWALGHVGPGAKAALLPLAARLGDGDASVRFHAGESLGRIDRKSTRLNSSHDQSS